jgi:hydrogenase nickel incorporation protein HypA/HybF
VTAVKVRVGVHRGIIMENLRYLFNHAAKGTPAENAVLEIEEEPVRVECPACGTNESRSFVIQCPVCKGDGVRVSGGDSLAVVSIEMDAPYPAA